MRRVPCSRNSLPSPTISCHLPCVRYTEGSQLHEGQIRCAERSITVVAIIDYQSHSRQNKKKHGTRPVSDRTTIIATRSIVLPSKEQLRSCPATQYSIECGGFISKTSPSSVTTTVILRRSSDYLKSRRSLI